jgi:predicted  nucleic acid-binding Zn-ribbon protein
MAQDIKQQITMLVELQAVEIEIRKVERVLSAVDQRISGLDAQLAENTAAVDGAGSILQDLEKRYRLLESDLQTNQGRIEKAHEKLRSIKTNKEYQSGLKEIDELKAIGSRFEDEMLQILEQVEKAKAQLKEQKARLSKRQGEIQVETEMIHQEAREARERLEQMQSRARAAAENIPPQLKALYRRVAAARTDGIGIVPVCDAVCQGCHVNIPPQMYNELQRGDRLKNCPNCDRIIYWQGETDRPE